jgi:RNA polymerase sigma factor (sigma-70 family)
LQDAWQEARLSAVEAAEVYARLPKPAGCSFKTFAIFVFRCRLCDFIRRRQGYERRLERGVEAGRALEACPTSGPRASALRGHSGPGEPEALRRMVRQEFKAALRQALARLDGRLRRVARQVLARVPIVRIAERLGFPRWKAEYLVGKVRAYLQKRLRPWQW